jgi:hypothetical protein
MITDTSPQVVIPQTYASHWQGVYEPVASADEADISTPAGHFRVGQWTDPPTTDYGRACAAADRGLVGLMNLQGVEILVLSAEIWINAWVPSSEGRGGFFVRDYNWQPNPGFARDEYSTSDEAILRLLADLPPLAWSPDFTWTVTDRSWWMMDAGDPGFAPDEMECEPVPVAIEPGQYRVESARLNPNAAIDLHLHRLTTTGR